MNFQAVLATVLVLSQSISIVNAHIAVCSIKFLYDI